MIKFLEFFLSAMIILVIFSFICNCVFDKIIRVMELKIKENDQILEALKSGVDLNDPAVRSIVLTVDGDKNDGSNNVNT